MALNIDLDGFGFLESDASKLSPTLNKQPPISPIESESSSGISSLDSDDLKVSNKIKRRRRNILLLLLFDSLTLYNFFIYISLSATFT